MWGHRAFCQRLPFSKRLFKRAKGGVPGHPPTPRPAGNQSQCSSLPAPAAGSPSSNSGTRDPICSSTTGAGAVNQTTQASRPEQGTGGRDFKEGREVLVEVNSTNTNHLVQKDSAPISGEWEKATRIVSENRKQSRQANRKNKYNLFKQDVLKNTKLVIAKATQWKNYIKNKARMIGPRNLTQVVFNGNNAKALLDSGAQVNVITERFRKKIGLKMRPLEEYDINVCMEGTGGGDIPFLGVVEAYLKIPKANGYGSNQIFLVVEGNSEFQKEVPVLVGTRFQDELMLALPAEEWLNMAQACKRVMLSKLVAISNQATIKEIKAEVLSEMEDDTKEREEELSNESSQ